MTTESGLHYQLQQPLFTEGPSHLTNKQSKYSLTGSLPALHPNTHQASPATTDTTLMGVLVERWAHIILLGISSWHTEPRQSIHTAHRIASAIYTSAVHLNRERKGERQRLIRTARLSACVHEDTKDSREGVSGSWKAQPRVSKGACNWERKYWPQQHKEWPAWAASPAGKLLCNRVLCCNSMSFQNSNKLCHRYAKHKHHFKLLSCSRRTSQYKFCSRLHITFDHVYVAYR